MISEDKMLYILIIKLMLCIPGTRHPHPHPYVCLNTCACVCVVLFCFALLSAIRGQSLISTCVTRLETLVATGCRLSLSLFLLYIGYSGTGQGRPLRYCVVPRG